MPIIPKIWLGENPPVLIFSDTIEATTINNQWVEYTLNQTVTIDKSQEYWIGYQSYLNYPGSDPFPIGTDEGPAVSGYGDMIAMCDDSCWIPLSELGMNYNFNIQMYVNKNAEIDPSQLLGFNVYVMYWGEEEFQLLDYVDFIDTIPSYSIFDTCNLASCNAIYKVNAVWANNGDTCISAYANSKLFPEDDYVFILYENINEHSKSDFARVYPNPAVDFLNVESESEINNILIYNVLGQIILEKNIPNLKKSIINLGDLKTGVYMIRIESGNKSQIIRFIKN